jgi:hypothetical protein
MAMASPKRRKLLIAFATSRPALSALLAIGVAVVLASCGSARSTGYHDPHYPYGAPNVPISMSKCMRANGVPDFPDPREGPNGGGVGWPGGGPEMISTDVLLIMGQRIAGPVVASAAKKCKEYMGPSGPPPALTESQQRAAIARADCMRAHGLPNFPDPTFSGGYQQLSLPPGLNPQSPAVEQAAKACGLGRG